MPDGHIKIQPLLSADKGAFCHLLEFADTRLIINCGIPLNNDFSIYEPIKEIILNADGIIITSFDLAHFGAIFIFPTVPSFSSLPTSVLGRVLLEELLIQGVPEITSEKLDRVSTVPVKYSQPFTIKNLTICAFNSGYSIGNSIFKIMCGTEMIVVGYNINHKNENYLKGADLSDLRTARVFITNTIYPSVVPESIKIRDERILNKIKNNSAQTVVKVGYSRLVELLCILLEEKIMIVSLLGNQFMDRLRSMVEWAGDNALDIISSLNIVFGRVSDVTNQKLIIVVDDGMIYTGAILNRLNYEETLFINFGEEFSDETFKKIKINEFNYELILKVKKEKEVKNIESREVLDGEETESNWTNYKKTIFIGEFDRNELFPYIKRKRHNNDYGETVKFNFEKAESQKPSDDMNDEYEEIEHSTLISTGITRKFTYINEKLWGTSDLDSSKIIWNKLKPDHLVLIDDTPEVSQFYYTEMVLRNKEKVHLCSNEYLSSEALQLDGFHSFCTALASQEILNLKFTELYGGRVSKGIVKVNEGVVEFIGDYEKITVGNISLQHLRRSLLGNGMKVVIKDEEILVNDSVSIKIGNESVSIIGSESQLMCAVREIVYKYIAVI